MRIHYVFLTMQKTGYFLFLCTRPILHNQSLFPLQGEKMCVKIRSSSGKENDEMTQFFANTAASRFAQAACAAFSCADTNRMIILDAGIILLASFIILPLAVLVSMKTEQTVRIAPRLRLLSRFSARDRD